MSVYDPTKLAAAFVYMHINTKLTITRMFSIFKMYGITKDMILISSFEIYAFQQISFVVLL